MLQRVVAGGFLKRVGLLRRKFAGKTPRPASVNLGSRQRLSMRGFHQHTSLQTVSAFFVNVSGRRAVFGAGCGTLVCENLDVMLIYGSKLFVLTTLLE